MHLPRRQHAQRDVSAAEGMDAGHQHAQTKRWVPLFNVSDESFAGGDAPFRRLVNVSLKTAAFSALAHILTETFLPGEPLIPCDRTAARSQRVVLLKLLSMDEQQEDLTLSAVIAETLPARVLAKCVYDDQGCCVLYYMLSFLERYASHIVPSVRKPQVPWVHIFRKPRVYMTYGGLGLTNGARPFVEDLPLRRTVHEGYP